jgi:hypothetical protein
MKLIVKNTLKSFQISIRLKRRQCIFGMSLGKWRELGAEEIFCGGNIRGRSEVDLPTALCGLAQELKRFQSAVEHVCAACSNRNSASSVPWGSNTLGHEDESLLENSSGLQASQNSRQGVFSHWEFRQWEPDRTSGHRKSNTEQR